MEKLTEETNRILEISASEGSYDAYTDRLKEIVDELASLKEQKHEIETRRKFNRQTEVRLNNASTATGGMSPAVTEWEESMIRQLIDTVKVMSADRIKIYFRGGLEVEQELNR